MIDLLGRLCLDDAPDDRPVMTTPAANTCDLWLVRVSAAPAWLPLLDAAESRRVADFTSPAARDTFATSRAAQREVLATYAGVPAESVVIERRCSACGSTEHGRPSLATSGIEFSVSHSGGWVAIAVVMAGLIGIDIERESEHLDPADIAVDVLNDEERRDFATVPDADRRRWFYATWTRKEAAVKAIGAGLRTDLATVDVRGEIVNVAGAKLHLTDVTAPDGYAMALATSVPVDRVRPRHD
jgi:4'-phosphopantetheinyl transferase